MLEIRPIHLKPASEFVGKYHRHNIPPVGGKFAVSCIHDNQLCGVAICGRPTARKLDDGVTLEIYRNCTDGTKNACTKLYGACIRIARDKESMDALDTDGKYYFPPEHSVESIKRRIIQIRQELLRVSQEL